MELRGKSFLFTGGAGFIGSHLVDRLLEEDVREIVVFDNFARGTITNLQDALKSDRVKLFEVKGDITHQDEIDRATENMDGVFHTASLCLAYCQDFPRSCFDVNIKGTFNLLDACVRNSVKKVIFSSSSSIYGNALYSPMDENHPFENRNFYGASKIAGEAVCRAFYYKYRLPYVALRYMNVYGPRQDYQGAYVAIIIKIIDRLQQNLAPIIYGDGSQAFDFVYVKDVCEANILAMKSERMDEVYNISTGRQTKIIEIAKIIMEIMGKDLGVIYENLADDTLVTNRIGSTEKAERELGFTAKTTLEDGLAETVKWKMKLG